VSTAYLNSVKKKNNITFYSFLTGIIMSSLANKIWPGQNIDNLIQLLKIIKPIFHPCT